MDLKIKSIKAREIIDSRAMPTVEASVTLFCGSEGIASVPSGASTGIFEAVELRDNDKHRYIGKGVEKAVSNVNKVISPALINQNAVDFRKADKIMREIDGSDNFSNIGANASLSVSLALAKANAKAKNQELYEYLSDSGKYSLPTPMMNILNGGAHASNNIDIQEFMIVPIGFNTFKEKLQCGCEIYLLIAPICLLNPQRYI